MTRNNSFCVALLAALVALTVAACDDKKNEPGDGDKPGEGVSLTSPELCDHIIEAGDEQAFDYDGCVMRLDGLQIQLGDDAWKSTHGKCLAEANDSASIDVCLNAADLAAQEKAAEGQ